MKICFEFTKEEKVQFLKKLKYNFQEVTIQWKKETICYPIDIPWENFSGTKKVSNLLEWSLENTFEREFKDKLLNLWKY